MTRMLAGRGPLGARVALGGASVVLLLAAGCAEPQADNNREDPTVTSEQGPGQPGAEQAGSEQPAQRPTLDEAATALEAAIAALEPVLFESIPAEEWEESIGGYRVGCSAGDSQGRYHHPLTTAAAKYLVEGSWPRIEQTLAEHGFTSASAVPLEGGNAFVYFYNSVGDSITVSSIGRGPGADGGAGYGGKTRCHEGYERSEER